jgi:cytochrome c-type biogenesis protein CcmH
LVWLPWIAMAVVVVVALAVGTLGGGEPSDEARARSLEETIRCPQCASQSVADSETPSAKGVKVVIRERIEKGNTDEEIRDFIASRYGRDVLLDPSGSGFGALVWALPVVVALVAVGGLIYRFGDWRPAGRAVTQADRDLVDDAMSEDVRP